MALTKDDLNNVTRIVTAAIDELAGVVKDGFENVEKRLDRIDADVDALRLDVADVKSHLTTIENAFAMPAELRFAARKTARTLKRAS